MLVSNSSTLILLAKIGCLEEFLELTKTIEIPAEVEQESIFKEDSYDARFIQKKIKERKIIVKKVSSAALQTVLSNFRLDKGEAAAYTLFNSKTHKAILTDDGELIKLCKLEKVPFVCALAIVIILYKKQKLTKNQCKEKIDQLCNIGRYSKKITDYYKKMLR